MKRWIRVVLPSEIFILGVAAIYLTVTLLGVLFDFAQGINPRIGDVNQAGLRILIGSAASYGYLRVRNFHPACQSEYREWLRFTPWRPGLPLPLGPVHLVWQDLLIVGLLTGVSSLHREFTWSLIPSLFLAGYLTTMLFPLILTRKYVPAYLILVGLGGALYLREMPIGQSVLWIVLYGVAWAGQRDSLREIDQWDMKYFDEQVAPVFQVQGAQEFSRSRILGWPFDRMIPHRNLLEMRPRFAFALAFLAGWWWFVIIETTELGRLRESLLAIGLLPAAIFALSRTWSYCWGYAPPLTLAARIVRLRWIIPGYDIVFLAPILIFVWAGACAVATIIWDLNPGWTGPVQFAGLILIQCLCPPSLDAWRLTGNHRIIPATSQNVGELQETK
jgi:hypothetical protein